MSSEYEPVRIHLASVSAEAGQAMTGQQGHRPREDRFDTVKIVSANANGAQPVLPENPRRVIAEIVPHTPAAADAHTSNGWIGPKGAVINQGGTYITAGGQGPTYIRGTEAVWCTSDPASTTDLWLSVTETSTAE